VSGGPRHITVPNFVTIVVPLRRYCNFSNFQDGRRRHLAFLKSRNLLIIRIQRVETHLPTKFCQNLSFGCEDIKIFRFFKMAAAAILDFKICEMLLTDGVWRAKTHNCAKFCHIRSFRCRDFAIFRIFKMGAAAIVDF